MNRKNIIAAGHPVTVNAGREILWLGGNAFDAAVAAVFASMVAEPTLTSAGGGGYLMASPVDRDPVLFDFFVDMPGRKPNYDTDFFAVQVDFGTAVQEFHIGMGAVGIPGNPAGLLKVQKTLGCLELKDVLAPAIRAARNGVKLNHQQAFLVKILSPILTRTEQGRDIYHDGEHLAQNGSKAVMPEFSDFLENLAKEGSELFYRGEIASKIVELSNSTGGLIEERDLASYKVKVSQPISCEFAGFQVYLNPPPAQSGWLIKTVLSILDETRCKERLPISVKDFILASDLANQIRNQTESYTPEDKVPQIKLDRKCLSEFEKNRSSGKNPFVPYSRGCTTHVSVLDSYGNAASVTTSNGEGSGSVIPGTAIMLNNMLGEEDINPRGFHKYPPGTRLTSMMSPTIVLKDREPVLVTGTAGSNRIRSALTQLLIHNLYSEIDIQTSTELPRVHLEGSLVESEPGIDENELAELEKIYKIQRWNEKSLFFGGVNSVTCENGAADSRRGGDFKEIPVNKTDTYEI